MSYINILHANIAAAGIPIVGVSSATRSGVEGTRRVDFGEGATQQQQTTAHAMADAHNTLTVSATEATIYITPGQGQARETTITCGNLQAWDYKIYERDDLDTVVASGSVTDGELIVDATTKGRYIVEVTGANYATGYVEIEVK